MSGQASFEGTVAPAEYRRYRLADVDAVRKDLTAVGSFSGCGGSSLGLRLAGFRVPYAIEFVPAASETYAANFPDAYVDRRDIREVIPAEILDRLGLERGELDLFEGSPPCASFSNAGKGTALHGQVKKYSDTKQRTDDLFFEWLRLLAGLMPRAFVAENVPGMLRSSTIADYAWKVSETLSKLGYRVRAGVLNACHYGVPQDRRRLFFVGVREDVETDPYFPPTLAPAPAHTLRQALDSVPRTEDEEADRAAVSIERFAIGRLWRSLVVDGVDRAKIDRDRREEEARAKRDGRDAEAMAKDYFSLAVPDLDRPCPTLTATAGSLGAASVVHPREPRKFTPGECLAISAFPSDFELTGTVEQRIERVGRAVPPPLMRAVAETLGDALRE